MNYVGCHTCGDMSRWMKYNTMTIKYTYLFSELRDDYIRKISRTSPYNCEDSEMSRGRCFSCLRVVLYQLERLSIVFDERMMQFHGNVTFNFK